MMTRRLGIGLSVIAILGVAGCSSEPSAVATTSTAPSPPSVSLTQAPPGSGTTSALPSDTSSSAAEDKSAATIKEFASKVAAGDPSAKDLAVPGTSVAVYAESSGEFTQSNPGVAGTAQPVPSGSTGWTISQGVVLSDFVMSPEGLIADASRNGVPLSKIVAPGDGSVYVRSPDGQFDTFTGQANFTVRAYRLFGDALQVLVDIDNQSSGDASVTFDSYVANGKQYPQSFDAGMGDASQPTKPTVKRTAMIIVGSSAPSGGTLVLRPAINYSPSQEDAWTMTVPNLG